MSRFRVWGWKERRWWSWNCRLNCHPPPPSRLCCCVSSRTSSSLDASFVQTFCSPVLQPCYCLLSCPQASNQKEATRKSWGWPPTNPVSLSAQIHHHKLISHALYAFTSEYTVNIYTNWYPQYNSLRKKWKCVPTILLKILMHTSNVAFLLQRIIA